MEAKDLRGIAADLHSSAIAKHAEFFDGFTQCGVESVNFSLKLWLRNLSARNVRLRVPKHNRAPHDNARGDGDAFDRLHSKTHEQWILRHERKRRAEHSGLCPRAKFDQPCISATLVAGKLMRP